MRKKIYEMIEQSLKEIKNQEGKSIIKHIDLYNNQTSMPLEEQPFYLPAVFVDFNSITYSDVLSGKQTAEVSLSLRVLTDARTKRFKDAMFSNVLLCNLICSKLYGKTTTLVSALTRTSSTTDNQSEEWIENIEGYRCFIKDNSAIREFTFADIQELDITTDLIEGSEC